MNNKISIIFIGTAGIGAPLLEKIALDDRFDVDLVITQVDRPAGRKMQLKPSPIKAMAGQLRLPVFQPEDINSPASLSEIRGHSPDMIVLMAYGQILKSELLDVPRFGCINVHASLLPKYRGASPIQQSLLEQEDVTGVSIMKMVEQMDAGPVYKLAELSIAGSDNAITLSERLANQTAYETPDVLFRIANGDIDSTPQNDADATYCTKVKKSDGEIDWNEDGKVILAKIRAFAGWPTSFTFWNGKRIKVLAAHYDDLNDKPGHVFEKDHVVMVGCGKGTLVLDQLQLEGKEVQDISMFIKGHSDLIGYDFTK